MPKMRLSWRIVPLLLFPALAACGPERRPSIVVVSIDSMRDEQVEARVGTEPVAPTLAALAEESVVYERAIAPAPWTTPSMMSMSTGLDADAHGVEEHDRALSGRVELLAERFREAGYRTAAIVPAITLRAEYGFERGFEVYDFESFGHNRISSPSLVGKVQFRVEEWRDEPFFIWVHLWDPHYNYIPEPPWDTVFERGEPPETEDVQCMKWIHEPVSPEEAEYLLAKYQGETRYTDEYVAQLLQTLEATNLRDDVILAVLGDHGESFLEHGWLGHTNRVDDTNVHVPLMLNWRAGGLEPQRHEGAVSIASLGRTLLRLAGLQHRDFGALPELPLPGRPETRDGEASARWPLSRTVRRGCFASLHADDLKYVLDFRTCRESLFDLGADPDETEDLAAQRSDDVARLRGVLAARYRANRDLSIPRASMPAEIVESSQARLRTLGYVAGGGGDAAGDNAQVACAAVTPQGRDAFGDLVVDEPCPEGGVLDCLDALGDAGDGAE